MRPAALPMWRRCSDMKALSAAVALSIALLAATLALASPSSAAVNGFAGGDGDQACAGAEVDWACLGDIDYAHGPDASLSGDDVFKGGAKEVEPAGWTFESGSTNGKTDVRSVWSAPVETAAGSFLNLAFWRRTGEGDAFFSFELNQSKDLWTNTAGVSVPCRTDGDVLVSYEIPSTVTMRLFSWEGSGGPAGCPDGGTGAWKPAASSTTAAEGAMNAAQIPNTLTGGPATLDAALFGEASLDLSEVVADVGIAAPCEYFTSMQAHSRVSSQLSSTLGDYVAPAGVTVAACKDPDGSNPDTTPPAKPELAAVAGCKTSRTVTLTGKAEAGSQVQIAQGATTLGLATAAADGTWSKSVTFASDGTHTVVVRARDAAANVSVDSDPVQVKVDTAAPSAPVVVSHLATVASVVIGGTAEPGATLEVLEGATVVAQATAGSDGGWVASIPAATAGEHRYDVVATDACGNASGKTRYTLTVPAAPDPLTGTDVGTGGVTAGQSTNGTGTTTGKPGDQIAVLGDRADGCNRTPFMARVNAKGLKRATFYVDGKKVSVDKTADKLGRFAFQIQPSKYGPGKHKIKVVTLSKKGKTRTVPMRAFTACGLGDCVSRRGHTIRVKKVKGGDKVVQATVFVNGKRVKVVRGKRLTAPVELSGLPKGKFTVKVISKTKSGRTVVDTRRYKTCEGTSSKA